MISFCFWSTVITLIVLTWFFIYAYEKKQTVFGDMRYVYIGAFIPIINIGMILFVIYHMMEFRNGK